LDKQPVLSRAVFIRFLLWLAGILGLGGLVRYFSYKPGADQVSQFQVGAVENFPAGSTTFRLEIPAVIYNDNGVLRALRLTCTHLGCVPEAAGDLLQCPCHGSEFDREGKVVRGPATRPLQALEVEISPDGQVSVKVS
jgi:cytochrome b6-f complex iron-sulfur subunit